MPTPAEISVLVATIGSGLVAGLCFAFSSFIMTSLDRLSPPEAIRAMQSINATILRSSAMAVWFGTAAVGVAAACLAENSTLAITAATLYIIGAVLITGRGNVPLNDQLDRVDPGEPDAAEAWQNYRLRWSRWNTLRTAILSLATAGFALAA